MKACESLRINVNRETRSQSAKRESGPDVLTVEEDREPAKAAHGTLENRGVRGRHYRASRQ